MVVDLFINPLMQSFTRKLKTLLYVICPNDTELRLFFLLSSSLLILPFLLRVVRVFLLIVPAQVHAKILSYPYRTPCGAGLDCNSRKFAINCVIPCAHLYTFTLCHLYPHSMKRTKQKGCADRHTTQIYCGIKGESDRK